MKRPLLFAFVLSYALSGCGGSEFEGKKGNQGGKSSVDDAGGSGGAEGGAANTGGNGGQPQAGGPSDGGNSGTTKSCDYQNETYEIGATFPAEDGCNECSCTENGVTCMEGKVCAITCTYGDQIYQLHDEFPAGDGCNQCTCLDTGVACGTQTCAEPV